MSAQASRARIRPATVRSAILRRNALSAWKRPFRSGSCRGCRAADSATRRPAAFMSCSTRGPLWLEQIVHNDDVAFRECGNETLLHPFLERGGVDRPIESLLRHEAAKAQAGDERDRLVMAVRNGGAQPSPAPTTSAFARQIGGGAGLVDEDELRRIEIELAREPVPALLQNVRALLLLGMRGLFLKVISWRSKKRHSTEDEKRSPQLAISRSWISSSVMSGGRRMRPSR